MRIDVKNVQGLANRVRDASRVNFPLSCADLLLVDARKGGRQFLIATHSPILLACPGARIYSFDAGVVAEAVYDDLEHVSLTKAFLNNRDDFLRRLSS